MPSLVAIDLDKAALLATALARAGSRLAEHAARTGPLLLAHGDDPAPAADLAWAALELERQGARLLALVGTVAAWQAAGVVPPGMVVSTSPLHPSERDPEVAARTAAALVALYRRDRDVFARSLARSASDPVVASLVLRALGVDALVAELDLLGYSWGLPAEDEHGEVVAALAACLATTTRSGAPAFTPAELDDAARSRGFSPAVMGLLFARCERWDPAWLAGVVDEVLVPLDRAVLRGRAPSEAWIGSGDDMVDGRVLVLQAVLASPEATSAVLRGSDLTTLLSDVGYLDGGAAIGAVLVAGTRPTSDADVERLAPAVVRVADAVQAADELAPVAHDRLGDVFAPWIEGFGTEAFGPYGHPDPLPGFDGERARATLARVMASEAAAVTIDAAAWAWAAAALAHLGPHPDPVDGKHIADVVRAVADASHAAERAEVAALDAADEAARNRWNLLLGVATAAVPAGPITGAVLTGAVTIVGGRVLASVLADEQREREALEGLPAALAADQRSLVYHALAVLWHQRDGNGLFAAPGATPAPGQAASPVGRTFCQPSGLRPFADLGEAERRDFDAWVLEQNHRGATVAALLDAMGAEFGQSGDD
jgi:hypothetical protein